MHHCNEVAHACAEALWSKQETQFGYNGLQAIFPKVTFFPVAFVIVLRIRLADSQHLQGRIIADDFVEGAMPDHHRLVGKPFI